ncbi:hypothetical protein FB451DRAFT_1532373 [Mycena latifolia]|nr:hypothetical protein FB451DRAFT_1532373 [Mycena latifolia]
MSCEVSDYSVRKHECYRSSAAPTRTPATVIATPLIPCPNPIPTPSGRAALLGVVGSGTLWELKSVDGRSTCDNSELESFPVWLAFLDAIKYKVHGFSRAAVGTFSDAAEQMKRCGYFGPKSQAIIMTTIDKMLTGTLPQDQIYQTIASLLNTPRPWDKPDKNSELVFPLTFVDYVLVPYVTASLIAEDLETTFEAAFAILLESSDFGDIFNDIDPSAEDSPDSRDTFFRIPSPLHEHTKVASPVPSRRKEKPTSRRCSLSLSLSTLVFALANALNFPQAHQLRALLLNWGLATFPAAVADLKLEDSPSLLAIDDCPPGRPLSPPLRYAASPPTRSRAHGRRRLCCRRSAWSHRVREKDGADVSTLGVTFKCKGMYLVLRHFSTELMNIFLLVLRPRVYTNCEFGRSFGMHGVSLLPLVATSVEQYVG